MLVLEHSGRLSKTGVQIHEYGLPVYDLVLGMPIPIDWKRQNMYTRNRLHGSWWMFGDTEAGVDLPGPLVPLLNQRR